MKILGIVGSKRKNGNTSILVQESLKPFDERGIKVELIFLGDYDINGCNGCEGCQDTFECVIDDDMHQIYPKLFESDAIILGSPTYFYNVSGDIKKFIDRCYCLDFFHKEDRSVWMGLNEIIGMKYATVIAVCEQDNLEDMGYTADVMKKSLEALSYRVVSTVKILNQFTAGEVLKDSKALNESQKAGEKLFKTLELRNLLFDKFSNRISQNQIKE
ncbi:flavodoxin family protein [Methanosalsum natronophilum]|uniref:Flavodoxin family protein n=1 Tax=Methanosalsum natronophilum TaxID=768733 RepID=A0A424YSK5_9EURY|nr:MAG: flavodoxin family protein [Methanosalsum natronophilum]